MKKKKTFTSLKSPRKNQPKGDGKNESSLILSPELSTPGTSKMSYSEKKSADRSIRSAVRNFEESAMLRKDPVLEDVADVPNSIGFQQLFEPSEETKVARDQKRFDQITLRQSANCAFRKNTIFQ